MRPINFSKMSHDEAVARLEKIQAVLIQMIDRGVADLKEERHKSNVEGRVQVTEAFTDGSLTAMCSTLDSLQAREIGSNLRHRMGPKLEGKADACNEPLFV